MTDYFVDPDAGSDGNAGTSTGAAWATFQKAADTAIAGDTVALMNTATETTAAQVDFDTNAGTRTSPIKFFGANGSGVRLTTGHYVLQASASIANLLDFTDTADHVWFEGVDFDGNSNVTGILIDGTGPGDMVGAHFIRCRLHDASGDGMTIRGASAPQVVVSNCEVFNNGGDGMAPGAASLSRWGNFQITGCSIHDNTGNGLGGFNAQVCILTNNLIYDNGGDGIHAITAAAAQNLIVITQNVIFGNSGDGIDISLAVEGHYIIHNNIIRSNGNFGLRITDTVSAITAGIDFNCYSNNTSGASDETTLSGDNNITSDPDFVSETDGSENFLLNPDSPCHKAGLHGGAMGIGPDEDQAAGGGGGLIIHPGMTGGING